MAESETEVPIRDAATVIIVRRDRGMPEILMGQRGAKAVFMPSKFVFPGGALDDGDHAPDVGTALAPLCTERLAVDAPAALARPLARAAIREVWEETGLALGAPDPDAGSYISAAPQGWKGFLAQGLIPRLDALTFVFRAVTPPGRPRRFDARFFVADAAAITGDPDDFSGAEEELSHLQWIGLNQARSLELPFITEVVLAEVEASLDETEPRQVPFFQHDDERAYFRLL
ncbi:MAG: DNA mismatch repair protein MutT [Pseudomonadota bacterium]